MDAPRGCALTIHRERASRERKGVGPPAAAGSWPCRSCPRALGTSRIGRLNGRFTYARPAGRPDHGDLYLHQSDRRTMPGRQTGDQLLVGCTERFRRQLAGDLRCQAKLCGRSAFQPVEGQGGQPEPCPARCHRRPRSDWCPNPIHDRPTPTIPFAIARGFPHSDQYPNQCTFACLSAVPDAAPSLAWPAPNSDAVMRERRHVARLPVAQPDAMPRNSSRT